MTELNYSSAELMIINAARLLRDGDTVFVGVGQPNLACNLAKRTHAPNLVMIYEAGVIGAEPERLPLSIGDPTSVLDGRSVSAGSHVPLFYGLLPGNRASTTLTADYTAGDSSITVSSTTGFTSDPDGSGALIMDDGFLLTYTPGSTTATR